MRAEDVMTADVATCRSSDSLNRAAQLMWERRCGCVPVIDDDDHVVGLLTDRDVCMAAYTQGRRLDDIAAAVAMSRPVRTCLRTAALDDVEEIKVKVPSARLAQAEAKKVYEQQGIPIQTPAERVRHVVQAAFAGRRIVVFSGGATKPDDENVLAEIRAVRDGGGFGTIMGRNTFQRAEMAAKKLLSAAADVLSEPA